MTKFVNYFIMSVILKYQVALKRIVLLMIDILDIHDNNKLSNYVYCYCYSFPSSRRKFENYIHTLFCRQLNAIYDGQ